MPIVVNYYTKIIEITSPTTDVAASDLHDFIEDERTMASPEGLGYSAILQPEGKIEDPSNPGIYSQIILILNSPWQIQFWAGSGYTRLYGGKFVGGLADQPVKATGTAGDVTVLESPVDGVTIAVPAVVPAADVADAVWDEDTADHLIGGTYGGEVATKADTSYYNATDESTADSGTVNYGNVDSGTYTDTFTKNGTPWDILEDVTDGLDVEMVFSLPSADHKPGALQVFGYYEGEPTAYHYMELHAWNYETSVWDNVVEVFMPGGELDSNTYTHAIDERYVDRTNSGEVKIRLIHEYIAPEYGYNAAHHLYLDYVVMSSVNPLTSEEISVAVWDEPIADHLVANTTGHQMYHAAYDGVVHIDPTNGTVGTTFPTGTTHQPCKTLADAYTIAASHFIPMFHIMGALTIDSLTDFEGYTFGADRSTGNSITVTSMVNSGVVYFVDLTIIGALTGSTRFTTSVLGALTGFDGGAKNCLLTGDITITGAGANYFTDCDTYVTADEYKEISVGSNMLNIIKCRGSFGINDYTGSLAVAIDLVAGQVRIADTCVSGIIITSGLTQLTDESGVGCIVIDASLTTAGIADGTWDEAIGDHTTDGTFGAELATKADIAASSSTDQSIAIAGSVIYGTETSGTYASTALRDGTYWQVTEDGTDGLTAEMTFNLPSADHRPGAFTVFGRYEGVPASTHHQELWLYNYESAGWEELTDEFMPGGITSDETFSHEYYERHVDRDNSNEVKVRIIHHVTTYSGTHNLYLDYAEVSSISVITAADIADAVWDEASGDHITLATFGKLLADLLEDTSTTIPGLISTMQTNVTELLGLTGENVKWSSITHDVNNLMTAARITQYTDNTLVTPVKSWDVTATYNGSGEITAYQMAEV
jgi:hypothetical protein